MSQTTGYFQFYNSSQRPLKVGGCDVSHFQTTGAVNFASAYAQGARFVVFKVGGVFLSRFQARYIKCTVNGSYTNTSSIFNEILVYASTTPTGTLTERAGGKTVTGSKATPDVGSYSNFTDGSTSTYVLVGDNTQWVQVDLGATYYVGNLILYHYAGRKFKQNKVEYSVDGTTWNTLFDSDTSGEYVENGGIQLSLYGGISKDSVNWTAAHVASARAAGLKVGTYFFKNPNYWSQASGRFLNTTADASSHASAFYTYITDVLGASASDTGDSFAWLDWENDQGSQYPSVDNQTAYDYIQTFCDTFKYMSSGRQCGMYTAWYTVETLTGTTALHLCRSVTQTIGSVCPLWLSQTIDSSSSYPTGYGWNAFGYFASDLWTMWQYSYNNSLATAYGFGTVTAALDIDLIEGAIETIMPPTKVSGVASAGTSTSVTLTWTTGESDVRGYYVYVSGQATATISTGVLTYTATGLSSNTSYAVSMNAYDMWEISETTTFSVSTHEALPSSAYYTLLSTQL